MFRSYDHLHVAVTEENIQTSVALDGNPEPDLVHATGCKQPTLRFYHYPNYFKFLIMGVIIIVRFIGQTHVPTAVVSRSAEVIGYRDAVVRSINGTLMCGYQNG
jgi:hypothetical protein